MKDLKLIEKDGLIKVYETDTGETVVNGRELHKGLKAKRDFSNWIKTNLENVDALENVDYIFFAFKGENPKGGRPSQEYMLKLDIAKEICMVAGANPRASKTLRKKSKDYRKYLIEVEKKYKQPEVNSKFLFKIAEDLEKKEKQIERMKPKEDYYDALVARNHLTNFRDTAKELKVKQKDFMDWLEENNYIYRDSKNKPKPYAKHCPSLFELKEYTSRNGHCGTRTLITLKGRQTFKALLKEDELLKEAV